MLVDDWLRARFDAGDVVAHGVKAGLGRVDSDDLLQGGLATRELVLPVDAVRLAFLEQKRLRVLALLEHLIDVRWLVNVWFVFFLHEPPSWGH